MKVAETSVALDPHHTAMALSPLDPLMYAMLGSRALSHIKQGEFEQRRPDIGRDAFFYSFPFADARMRQLFDEALTRHGF